MRIYDNDTNDISKIVGNNDLTYCESNIIKELTKQSAPGTTISSTDKREIQKEIQKAHSLDSYKLDNVSSHFMKGKILTRFRKENMELFHTNNIG